MTLVKKPITKEPHSDGWFKWLIVFIVLCMAAICVPMLLSGLFVQGIKR